VGPAAKRDCAGLLYLEKESLDRRSGFLELAMSVRTDFAATQYLVDAGAFSEDPFTLIDVGCRGGIHSRWQAFGDNLKAYAIDPLIAEIEELARAEKNPNIKYWPGYIGLAFDHPVMKSRSARGPWGNFPWERLSAAWAAEIMASEVDDEAARLERNQWSSARLTESSNRVGLTEFVRQREIESVDFIKVDVDGEDLYVLLSGDDLIRDEETLGFELEVAFFGTDCESDNTFHNVDRLMRAHGYELFDLSVRKYSRRTLPAPFVLQMPAQTEWGAPFQGVALYVRDVAGRARESNSSRLSNAKLLKMIAVHELFGLPDCAAEIAVTFKPQLCAIIDVDHLLDMLTPRLNGQPVTYHQYCGEFLADPTRFYPPKPEPAQPLVRKPQNILRRKLSSLKRRLRGLYVTQHSG